MTEFVKLSGNGNDFIAIDNRAGVLSENKIPQFAREYCRRHYSLGADGLLLLENKENKYLMRYFNRDGSEGELCGNGARCFARYLKFLKLIDDKTEFLTRSGLVSAYLKDSVVGIRLSDVSLKSFLLDHSLYLNETRYQYNYVKVGVPHCVIFLNGGSLNNIEEKFQVGREIRYLEDIFPDGVNVNFVVIGGTHSIEVQTYERGVEEITQACGTGIIASTLVTHLLKGMESPVSATTQGGTLKTFFKKDQHKFFDIFQEGEVTLVAQGMLF